MMILETHAFLDLLTETDTNPVHVSVINLKRLPSTDIKPQQEKLTAPVKMEVRSADDRVTAADDKHVITTANSRVGKVATDNVTTLGDTITNLDNTTGEAAEPHNAGPCTRPGVKILKTNIPSLRSTGSSKTPYYLRKIPVSEHPTTLSHNSQH